LSGENRIFHIIFLKTYSKGEDSMAKQLHKRFSTEEVRMFMREYLKDKKKLPYILQILQISKRRFFQLVQEYRENPEGFSIDYQRKIPTRKMMEKLKKISLRN